MKIIKKNTISLSTVFLGIYFALLPFDLFTFASFGSVLKFFSIFPLILTILKINNIVITCDKLTKRFLLYVFVLGVSIIYSVQFDTSLSHFLSLFVNIVLVYVCGNCVTYSKKEIKFLKTMLAIAGVLTIVLTFVFSGFSYAGRLSLYINGEEMDGNTLNGYVMFLLITCVLILFKNKRIIGLLPLAVIFTFSLLTGSRGAMLAMLVITVYASIYCQGKKFGVRTLIMIILIIVFILLAWPFVSSIVPDTVLNRFTLEGMSGGSYRIEIWKKLMEYFMNSNVFRELFGNGFGTSSYITGLCYGIPIVAHNVWLDQLINCGIIGVVVLLLLQIQIIKTAFFTKDYYLIGTYIGFLVMSLTLSITSYKPLWNCIMMIYIVRNNIQMERKNEKNIVYHEYN